MELPDNLKIFEKRKGTAGEIIFSQGTYEVEVKGEDGAFWPFLQLSDKGEILDAFCTCNEFDKRGACGHLALSFLYIAKGEVPLHVEFKNSFFRALFQVLAKRFGSKKELLKRVGKGEYLCQKKEGFFKLKVEKEDPLKEILSAALATEETSLKFSRLPLEELARWRKGVPSESLSYELSFWSDLAKFFFLLQKKGSLYQVTFGKRSDFLPKEIKIAFKEGEIECSLQEEEWVFLIPTLNTIKTSLHLFDEMAISGIYYDSERGIFKAECFDEKRGKIIGNWIYVENKGFYPKTPPIFFQNEIEEIALDQFLPIFKRYLVNEKIHEEQAKLHYQLFFDKEYNLHIEPYLKKEGDLSDKQIKLLDSWIYIKGVGFYKLKEKEIVVKKVINRDDLSSFIDRNRSFLDRFPGFSVNFDQLPFQVSYKLDQEGLTFELKGKFLDESVVDLGNWVYIPNKGFYPKSAGKFLFLKIGKKVDIDDIADFISLYRDELEQIEGFFTLVDPIEKVGIEIRLSDGVIKVVPKIVLKKGYEGGKLELFGDVGYLEGSGFFSLPFSLPKEYQKEKIIPPQKEDSFIDEDLPDLRPFILFLDKKLQKVDDVKLKIGETFKRRRGIWEVDLRYKSKLGEVSGVDIWEQINNHKKYLFSNAGAIYLKDYRFAWLHSIKKRQINLKTRCFKINILTLLRLSALEDLTLPDSFWEAFSEVEEGDIASLKSTLRPYQILGFKWLWSLYSLGLSGLLCDEMGLGKTHQAMGLLAAVSSVNKGGKFLIIAPTSVVYHWEELLIHFLPSLKVAIYHGEKREIKEFDILLSSYGMVRLDKKLFKQFNFEIAIFDELQIAKNHKSKIHKTLKELKSKTRFGLTGTPIENRLRELKALFDIVLPHYLPSEAVFKENFIIPIEIEKNEERRRVLMKLIKPFILRRKKDEVLIDLPEKVEEIAYADLSYEQRELYKNSFLPEKERLLANLESPNQPIEYLHIFSLFSRLKQICDHPSLILGDLSKFYKHQSGKWDLFVELLNEARESGKKVVAFSQYLGMLSIIETYLKKKGIGFASIKGSTKNRQAEVKRFQQDPTCEVFVASLLAAGVGIDLSAASIVIHVDRWWNPAKENQATDRVHRIGQTRGVQVFKLVCKNTIEEHIHNMIEKKMGLIEKTIGKDDSDQIKILSREELLAIVTQLAHYNPLADK